LKGSGDQERLPLGPQRGNCGPDNGTWVACLASIMAAIGVGALLLFISETVGTAQELPKGTLACLAAPL